MNKVEVKIDKILKTVYDHPLGKENCFLCACLLMGENRTEEHVIPKWLQEKCNLWNDELTLLNGTAIPYRQLTIQCCNRCNNILLNEIEQDIIKGIDSGYDSFIELPKLTIYRWLSKIFLGILFNEYLVHMCFVP